MLNLLAMNNGIPKAIFLRGKIIDMEVFAYKYRRQRKLNDMPYLENWRSIAQSIYKTTING